MRTKKVHGCSDISLESIAAIWGVQLKVIAVIRQRDMDGFGVQVEWALFVVIPIFKRQGDIRNYSCYVLSGDYSL